MSFNFKVDFERKIVQLNDGFGEVIEVELSPYYRFVDPRDQVEYTLLSFSHPMRQHETVANYRDTEVVLTSAMRTDMALELIQLFSNITDPYFIILPVTASYEESINKLKDMILSMHRVNSAQLAAGNIEDHGQEGVGELIIKIVNSLLENQDYSKLKNFWVVTLRFWVVTWLVTHRYGSFLMIFHSLWQGIPELAVFLSL